MSTRWNTVVVVYGLEIDGKLSLSRAFDSFVARLTPVVEPLGALLGREAYSDSTYKDSPCGYVLYFSVSTQDIEEF